MTTDIFIRSYSPDFKWLEYCLFSCDKFAKGFSSIHIVVPEQDKQILNHLTLESVHGVTPACQDGYLDQQVSKLYADEFCQSDYILHLDSDCVWYKETTPQDFFQNGKPIILVEDGVVSPWPKITEKTLCWYDSKEYMRRLPIIYPRWVYPEFRKWIKNKHGMSLRNWISLQPYREFSEFNTLGQWLFRFHPEKFAWLHPSETQVFAKQFWSWGGVEKEEDQIKSFFS
jgi:hypothetical protein